MMRLELVVIESVQDAVLAGYMDVYQFAINDTECENCGMLVGPVVDEFFPCVLVQNSDDVDDEGVADTWPVCVDCAGGVLFPGEERESPLPFDQDTAG